MDGNRDRTASTTFLLLILVALERPPEAVEAKMEGWWRLIQVTFYSSKLDSWPVQTASFILVIFRLPLSTHLPVSLFSHTLHTQGVGGWPAPCDQARFTITVPAPKKQRCQSKVQHWVGKICPPAEWFILVGLLAPFQSTWGQMVKLNEIMILFTNVPLSITSLFTLQHNLGRGWVQVKDERGHPFLKQPFP